MSVIDWKEEAKIPGKRLKAARQSLGFSKADMAEVMGVTQRRITAIETGERRMNEKDFEMIGIHFPWYLRFVVYGGPMETALTDDEGNTIGFRYLPKQEQTTIEQIKTDREKFRALGQKMMELFEAEEAPKKFNKESLQNGIDSSEMSAQDLENAANVLFNISQQRKVQEEEDK